MKNIFLIIIYLLPLPLGEGRVRGLILLLFFGLANLSAQETLVPAKEQSEPIALVGGTAHLATGEVIENAVIGFEKGQLTIIGTASNVQLDKSKYKIIDVKGKHIYPGIIAPNTIIGLIEIDAARPTRDFREVGLFNPNVRSIIAYNTDSRVTPTIRSNGILLAQIVPTGGMISGSSSIVELDGWNWEDAAYQIDEGIFMTLPRMFIRKGKNKKWEEQMKSLKKFFDQAKAYSEQKQHTTTNLKFEAMRGLFNKTKSLYIRANYVREIIAAVNVINEYGVKGVIVGGKDSWLLTGLLKANNIAVVLGKTHSLPSRSEVDIDQSFKTPYILQKAGVLYCLSGGGSWEQRNLMFQAGTAAAYGLTKEEALQAITANTARILGIDNRVGTIEKGKDATLIVSSGDVLDMRSSNIEMAFIRGKQIDLNNKQKELYKKFKAKYAE